MTSPGKNPRQENGVDGSSPQSSREQTAHFQWNNLSLDVSPEVYPPHEDSFLLADAASKHATGKVLDLGCGSGIVGLAAAQNHNVTEITFADISGKALKNARHNATQNQIALIPHIKKLSFIRSNLLRSLGRRKFDTICFNPPYLPTKRHEKFRGELDRAFDGGPDGRKTIDRFLPEFGKHLPENGILLFLDCSLTNSGKTLSFLENHGFKSESVSSQRFFFEELRVLKIRKAL